MRIEQKYMSGGKIIKQITPLGVNISTLIFSIIIVKDT